MQQHVIETSDHARIAKNQSAANPPLFRRPATHPFEIAIRALSPWTSCYVAGAPRFPGLQHYLVELLGHRVEYGAIHGWRFGRRRPPRWAVEVLAAHLDRMASEASEAARLLRQSDCQP
jgi:hypothetical protein